MNKYFTWNADYPQFGSVTGTALPSLAVISCLATTKSLYSMCSRGVFLLFLACHAWDSPKCCTAQFFPGPVQEPPIVLPHVSMWVMLELKSGERVVVKGLASQCN